MFESNVAFSRLLLSCTPPLRKWNVPFFQFSFKPKSHLKAVLLRPFLNLRGKVRLQGLFTRSLIYTKEGIKCRVISQLNDGSGNELRSLQMKLIVLRVSLQSLACLYLDTGAQYTIVLYCTVLHCTDWSINISPKTSISVQYQYSVFVYIICATETS